MTLKLSTIWSSEIVNLVTSKAVIRLWCGFCCHSYTKVAGIGSLHIESDYRWHGNPEFISAIYLKLLSYILRASTFALLSLSSLYFWPLRAIWLSFELLSVYVWEKLQRKLQDCHVTDVNQFYRFKSTCLLSFLTGVLKAQIWVQPLLASIPDRFNETQLISILIALLITVFLGSLVWGDLGKKSPLHPSLIPWSIP